MVTENERDQAGEAEVGGSETDLKRANEDLSRALELREAAVVRLEQALAGKDGEIAAKGVVIDEFLEYLLGHPYFNRVPPDLSTQKATENRAIVMGTEVPLATFPPGKYTVIVNLEDKVTGSKASRELSFEVK